MDIVQQDERKCNHPWRSVITDTSGRGEDAIERLFCTECVEPITPAEGKVSRAIELMRLSANVRNAQEDLRHGDWDVHGAAYEKALAEYRAFVEGDK